jgi:AcrR family transcriptional regulator
MPDGARAAKPDIRARGKDERRSRVIRAAIDLIGERADGAFSMQELALRAGLSPATPYNLFGTKSAILQEVFRVETEGFRRNHAKLRHKPAAQRVMATIDQLVAVYVAKPHFYRSLLHSINGLGPNDIRQMFLPLTDAMFQPLVEELIADGVLGVRVSPSTIATHLVRIFEATFLHWAAEGWDEEHFRRQLRAGFAISFLGLLTGKDREALLAVIDAVPLVAI